MAEVPQPGNADEQVAEREAWTASGERRKILPLQQMLTLIAAGGITAAFAVPFYSAATNTEGTSPSGGAVAAGIALGALGVCAALWGVYRLSKARVQFLDRLDAERRGTIEAIADELEDVTDLRALIRLNRSQMELYQGLTRRQADTSYRYSQIALGLGLIALIGGIVVIVAVHDATAKISVSAVTAVSAALTSYIARTYLRVYERALKQLNLYFEQPLVTSYILTAERLARHMSAGKQDETLGAVITEVLGAAGRRFGTYRDETPA